MEARVLMREVEEWIAKHDDQAVPPRVRLRVFNRCNGVCWLSKRKIMPGEKWELEHKLALSLGGEHRESNLAPALVIPHRAKTKIDRRVKAKNDRVRKRHLGIKKPRSITRWRKFNGEIVTASRSR
jgi:5-methylcytosine-specific restriction protein A